MALNVKVFVPSGLVLGTQSGNHYCCYPKEMPISHLIIQWPDIINHSLIPEYSMTIINVRDIKMKQFELLRTQLYIRRMAGGFAMCLNPLGMSNIIIHLSTRKRVCMIVLKEMARRI